MYLLNNNITTTFTTKNNIKTYNIRKCFKYLEIQGKQVYGQSFKIQKEDKPTIYKLLIYAIRDKENALKLGIDLNKGILLSGSAGCGKTAIMHLIKPFLNTRYNYRIKTTREVSFEIAKKGVEAMHSYTQKSNHHHRLDGYCFDNLGVEQQIRHFGNNYSVMAEILMSRYGHFVENNSVTHITTDLSPTEFGRIYGKDTTSMFNIIVFDKATKDKR